MVAIGPQIQRQSDFMAGAAWTSLPGADRREQLWSPSSSGWSTRCPEYHRDYYLSILVNIPFVNGEKSWRLPLPATYVVSPRPDGALRRGSCGFSRAAGAGRGARCCLRRKEPLKAASGSGVSSTGGRNVLQNRCG